MREPTRPGARPRRSGPLAEIRATGTRHRHLRQRRAPEPGPRAAWAFAVVALVMGAGAILVILFGDVAPRTALRVTPAPTDVATAAPPSPSPSSALALGGGGDDPNAGRPDRTPPPGAEPTAPAEPSARPASAGDLRVEFPRDGETVVSPRLNVFGRAPGGARVLRELPDGTTAVSVARPDGVWVLRVDLEPGENTLRFRLERDRDPVVVRVTLQVR